MNTTNITKVPSAGLSPCTQATGAALMSADQGNNLGFGVGKMLRTGLDYFANAWQNIWRREPSAAELTLRKQEAIYCKGLKGFIEQLNIDLSNLRRNPNDPSSLQRIENLASQHPHFLKPHDNNDLRTYQDEQFKSLEGRVSGFKPQLKEKLKHLLPMVFQNNKTKKDESAVNPLNLSTRNISAQKNAKRSQTGCTPPTLSYNLNNLAPTDGFVINYPGATGTSGDYFGRTISSVGDLNNDTINDFAIGTPYAGPPGYQVYLIFGKKNLSSADINLSNRNGQWISINDGTGDEPGLSISPIGDLNDDGYDDFAIGARTASPSNNGKAFVLFGPISSAATFTNLNTDLDGTNGFIVCCFSTNSTLEYELGSVVSGGEDINGDNIDDLLIGEPNANKFYGIYGHKNPWPSQINTTQLNVPMGFTGVGPSGSLLGISLTMGKLNNGGIGDFAVGAPGASTVYVFYGQNSTWTSPISLNLNGTNGFTASSQFPGDNTGVWVKIGGDLNKDNITDLLIGSQYSSSPSGTGKIYVLYHPTSPAPSSVYLPTITGAVGIEFDGSQTDAYLGFTFDTIDMNNDGNSDLIAGMFNINSREGEVVGILGPTNGLPNPSSLAALNGTEKFVVNAITPSGWFGYAVANIGDINADGVDDIAISAPINGTVYILFGKNATCTSSQPSTTSSTIQVATSASMTTNTIAITTTSGTGTTTSGTGTTSSNPTTTSNSATTTSASSHSSSIDAKTLGIALGVSIGTVVAGVIAAIVVLKLKKKACFADAGRSRSETNNDDGRFDI